LSDRQLKTALRLAQVPKRPSRRRSSWIRRHRQRARAAQGTKPKPKPLVDLQGIPWADYARATETMGTLRRFAEFCQTLTISGIWPRRSLPRAARQPRAAPAARARDQLPVLLPELN